MADANHLGALLRRSAESDPDAIFLRDGAAGSATSHGAFIANAERMAAALAAAGVAPGDRVAVQADKTPAVLELYAGTVLAGGAFLPLNPAYTARETEAFLEDAEPRVLVCDPDRLGALEPAARRAGAAAALTLDGRGGGTAAEARDAQAPGFAAIARGPDDLAAILYTSGTTGRSKGAMLTHRNLASNAEALARLWGFSRDDALIHALPVFHTHGLFVATNVALAAGCQCLFMARFDAAEVVSAMPGATALMGVPTHYVRLLAQDGLREAAAGMRLFVSGSAPLAAETHRRWREQTGHDILERYGMTETSMNASNPLEGERRPGSVGFALPGVELRIRDPESGAERGPGETGMIEVRGPNVFAGYWRAPQKTAQDLRPDGWFVTGDVGAFDADGYLHIAGRSGDMIISGGLNVYPREVEAALDELPMVHESAVIGVPHPDFGEGVVAVVVARQGAGASPGAIMDAIAGRLARYKLPKRVVVVDDLPRNAMGKVRKDLLRKEHARLLA